MSMIPTHDTNGRATLQAATTLHRDIVAAKSRLGAEAFRLGDLLVRMQDGRGYVALGHGSFEDYLASDEVGLHRTTAYRFMRIARVYGEVVHDRPWMQNMDLAKLDILTRLIDDDTDPATIADLAEQARELPRAEVRAAVRAEAERRGVLPHEAEAVPRSATPIRLVPPAPATPDPGVAGIVAMVERRLAEGTGGESRRWADHLPAPPRTVPVTVVAQPGPPADEVARVTPTTVTTQPARTSDPVQTVEHILAHIETMAGTGAARRLVEEVSPESLAALLVAKDRGRNPDEEYSFGEMLTEGDYRRAFALLGWLGRVVAEYEGLGRQESA